MRPFAIGIATGAALAFGAVQILRRRRRRIASWCTTHTLGGVRFRLRSAREDDVHHIYRLTHALAEVCNEAHELIETGDGLLSAFQARMFEALVLELAADDAIIGMAMFQESYRTWSGNSLYLQDLIIDNRYRGLGLGTLVLQSLAHLALERGCDRLFWETTSDNAKARAFYSGPAVGAKHAEELLTYKLVGVDKLSALASSTPYK